MDLPYTTKVTVVWFDPATFAAVILYIPTSLICASEIVNECRSGEKIYCLVLFDISTTSSRLGWKYHWISEETTGGTAVILKKRVTELFLNTAIVDFPFFGITCGGTTVKKELVFMYVTINNSQ